MMIVDKVCRSLPKMCCLCDTKEEVLIVKFMAGVGHETSLFGFPLIMIDNLRDLRLRDKIRCI